jgi:hypothetical protein
VNRLWRAIRRWLLGDRIRTGAADGAIYRLTPGSVVVVRGQPLRIVAAEAIEGAIVYDCDSERGACRLWAEIRSGGPRLVLIEAGRAVPVAPLDVEIFRCRG